MQDISDLFPVTPLIDANVPALAFLLCALAAFIKALVSRIDRVIDRSRFIHENDPSKSFLATPSQAACRVSESVAIPRHSRGDPYCFCYHHSVHQHDVPGAARVRHGSSLRRRPADVLRVSRRSRPRDANCPALR
jgi:hypothetical protein